MPIQSSGSWNHFPNAGRMPGLLVAVLHKTQGVPFPSSIQQRLRFGLLQKHYCTSSTQQCCHDDKVSCNRASWSTHDYYCDIFLTFRACNSYDGTDATYTSRRHPDANVFRQQESVCEAEARHPRQLSMHTANGPYRHKTMRFRTCSSGTTAVDRLMG